MQLCKLATFFHRPMNSLCIAARFTRTKSHAWIVGAIIMLSSSSSAVQAMTLLGEDIFSPDSIASINVASSGDPIRMINLSGLSATPTRTNYASITHNVNGSDKWFTTDGGTDYFEDGGVDPVIEFDLGQTLYLTDMVIWGTDAPAAPQNIFIELSSDGGANYGTPFSFSNLASSATPETHAFGGIFPADFVRYTVTDNFGGDRVVTGEVMFLGGTSLFVVPEPSSALLLGCGLIVFACRRRKACKSIANV